MVVFTVMLVYKTFTDGEFKLLSIIVSQQVPSPNIVNVNVQRCRIWTTLLNVFPMLKISTGRQFCQHRQSLTSPTAGHRHGGHRQPVQLDLRLHHRQRGILRRVGHRRLPTRGVLSKYRKQKRMEVKSIHFIQSLTETEWKNLIHCVNTTKSF